MRHVQQQADRAMRSPQIIGHLPSGKPIWSIGGGSNDQDGDDQDDDDGDDQDDDDGDDQDDDGDDPDDKKLGPAGEKALAEWKRRAREAERALRQTRTKNDDSGKKNDDQDDDDPDTIRERARDEARAEVARDRALDKLEVRAAKTFADADDARALLADRADEFLDDDGKPDVEAIDEALEDLLENKPHLAAQRGKWKGGGDGGARRSKPKRPKSVGDAVSRAYTAGS